MAHNLSRLEEHFHRIARQLTRFDLQKLGPTEEKPVSAEELVADLENHTGSSLFMGYYSRAGLIEVLERYGITKLLKSEGFSDLHLHVQTGTPFRHVLQLYWGTEPDPDRLLIEIALHEGVVVPRDGHVGDPYDVVFVEWLCLENPVGTFQPARPRLPGQRRPGLGIAMEVAALLLIMAERLRKDGLVNIPRYYHTAWGGRRAGFLFLQPETEGVVRALERDVGGHSLAEASWAVELGLVRREGSSEPFLWTGEEQVSPTSDRMKRYFASEDYNDRCLRAERSTRFVVNWDAYESARIDTQDRASPA